VRVSVLVPDQIPLLPIDSREITRVQGHQRGMGFLRMPVEAWSRRYNRLRLGLILMLRARKGEKT